ncbi:dynein heavy chain, putative [Brachyspira pilosicoli 95/1000]|uniref:Dynein heavy chain, putative n=3 Tax=Brachyspira pilosicoli TaxID=52584 RepID=D8IBL9_BRAP9|nr:dynein heavy chain, putative [Brachyspira pilosicoli 95/1000]
MFGVFMIKKVLLLVLFLFVACNNKDNLDKNQENTENIENNYIDTNQNALPETITTTTTTVKSDGDYNEWFSPYTFMKNDNGSMAQLALNDMVLPEYNIAQFRFTYIDENLIKTYFYSNATIDNDGADMYAQSDTGYTIRGNYYNKKFTITTKIDEVDISASDFISAVSYNYLYTNSSQNDSLGNGSTFFYKDSIFVIIPKDTNNLEVYDKITLDINNNIDNIVRDERLWLKNETLPFFEKAMSDFYNDWYTNSDFNYEYIAGKDILYFNDTTISINSYSSIYMGGAHGVYNNTSLVYSLKDGEKISITNLIKDFKDEKLRISMKSKLLSISDRTEEDYLVPLDEITLEDTSFYVYKDGIHFVWPIYTITAYVQGETEIVYSFDEIRPFVNEEYLYILEE